MQVHHSNWNCLYSIFSGFLSKEGVAGWTRVSYYTMLLPIYWLLFVCTTCKIKKPAVSEEWHNTKRSTILHCSYLRGKSPSTFIFKSSTEESYFTWLHTCIVKVRAAAVSPQFYNQGAVLPVFRGCLLVGFKCCNVCYSLRLLSNFIMLN